MLHVALVLLLAAVPTGVCTELGCAHVADRDGDGRYEWANAALGRDVVGLSLNANGTLLTGAAVVTLEEHVEQYPAAEAAWEANGTRNVTLAAAGYEGHEETGELRTLALVVVNARDADGDGAPETVTTRRVLP